MSDPRPFAQVTMKRIRETKRYVRFEAIGGQGEPIGTLYVRKDSIPEGVEIVRVDVTGE